MQAITVPTINSNDTDALLQTWLKADGDEVRAGETIAVLETTKASFDLIAEADGLLHAAAPPARRYPYGEALGWIFTDAAEREQFFISRSGERRETAGGDMVLTNAARDLAAKHGLTEERLRSLGKKVLKTADLEPLLGRSAAPAQPAIQAAAPAEAQAAGGLPVSPQQQTIARVVSRSHAVIPDSFILKKIGVEAALEALAQFSRDQKALATLPDLLVWITARLPAEFPFFFGALRDDLSFAPSTAGSVGVTFDVGHGLYIPVVRDAAALSLKETAKRMMGFRMRAARNSFRAEDLAGGDISISLNMDADVMCVIPVILPGQTCMLSVSAVLSEVALDAEQRPVLRRFIQLGAAFDHRVINGYHANAFLNAIKARIESPDLSQW